MTCEVNIPQYLNALGFSPNKEWDKRKREFYLAYDIQIAPTTNCGTAGWNLPWSFSLTKIYQLFVKATYAFSACLNVRCLLNWANKELTQIGRDELQSFFNTHKEHKNPNLVGYTYSGEDAFFYFLEPWKGD